MDPVGLGGIFYINLDERTDRRIQMEQELHKMGIKAERFPAIKHEFGIVGCGQSHLAVLKLARDRGLKNVLVFEDDFEFLVSPEEFWKQINTFFAAKIDYDVVFLGYNMFSSENYNNFLYKVLDSQTASAYIVNAKYYDTLIYLWERCVGLQAITREWDLAHDMQWKILQPRDNYFAFKVRLGKQRGSYSDIQQQFVEYDC